MQCSKCHTENLADAAFCEECAAPLEAACASCGAGNRPSAKFCRKCRAPLGAAPAATPAAARDPRTYTPKHLADKILQSRSALEGERKQVTVLFADVMIPSRACGTGTRCASSAARSRMQSRRSPCSGRAR